MPRGAADDPVGAGGIGKTRLAVELGHRLSDEFADGRWLAELGAFADPALVPVAVASTLGLELVESSLTPVQVAAALREKRLLLVLDTCEHVLDAAAGLAEALCGRRRGSTCWRPAASPWRRKANMSTACRR